MATLTLEQLIQCVQELPALPNVAIKVVEMTADATVSAREVSALISSDMALTTRVLRIANSAYYGMPRSISTVNEAVIILGMQALRNLALAAGAYDTLKRELPGYCLGAGALWRHSLISAIGAQVLAKRTRITRMEEAFVAGLLHDVGKVVLSVYVAPQFEAIRALAELDGMPFYEAEKLVLGFDHAEVGMKIAEKWNLPPSLCLAIAGHHCLDQANEQRSLAALVHVANYVAISQVNGLSGDIYQPQLEDEALDLLGVTDADLEDVGADVMAQVDKARPMFESV